MKSVIVLAAFVVLCIAAKAEAANSLTCTAGQADVPKNWIDMRPSCIREMKRQIQEEINASMRYLMMGAYFSRDTVNRPGFAKFFFASAGEEREHGHKLIEYLLMRGQLTSADITSLIRTDTLSRDTKTKWASGADALKDALRLEAKVTASIRRVIEVCESDQQFNDYHLVDYLTGTYLEEQYHGQRELAGKISTLDKLVNAKADIGEFLYDKKLLA